MLLIFNISLYPDKLSKVQFYTNSQYLSPDDDGYNDDIIFNIIFYQDAPIKVKKWFLKIRDNQFRIVYAYYPTESQQKYYSHTIYWNGKDFNNNYIPEGNYEAILQVEYDYGNIIKQFSISISVYKNNFDVELNILNPYEYRKWNAEKKLFEILNKNILIQQIYKKDFSIFSEFSSFIINSDHILIEKRNWEKKPNTLTSWDGNIQNKPADFDIYHYIFSYKSFEKQIYQYIVPGIVVVPFTTDISLMIAPFVLNEHGYGYKNNKFEFFEIYKIQNKIKEKYKESSFSKYFQIYCQDKSFVKKKWNFYKEGEEFLSKNGILNILKLSPKNKYCQVLFFNNPVKEYEYEKVIFLPIYANLYYYIDSELPELKIDLKYKQIRLFNLYENYIQKIQIKGNDNSFIKRVNLKLYLIINNYEKLLIKEWNLPVNQIGTNSNQIEKEIYWYGDTIQNLNIESLENFILELIAIDYANNVNIVTADFSTDLFFKDKEDYFITNIPLSNLIKDNNEFIKNIKDILFKIKEEYIRIGKKYIYLKVYSYKEGKDEENLKNTEKIAKEFYQQLIKYIPKSNIFYRGMGELFPYLKEESSLSKYKNNRLEIIITDQLLDEEKNIY